MVKCKIGTVGRTIRCAWWKDGECINIDKCIYKDRYKKNKDIVDLTRYIIEAKNPEDCWKYHRGNGTGTDMLQHAEFYENMNFALEELKKFDDLDDYNIREVKIHLEVI